MKAVILAGGEGTRLRPLTNNIPKPLLPIGKKPILEIIIERLRIYGFTEIILNVKYKAELIRAYFHNGSNFNVKIYYVEDKEPCGTAGPIKLAENLLDGDPFLAMNGDLLTDLDFRKMYQTHIDRSVELTVATKTRTMELQYGIIETENNSIISIKEKPVVNFIINAGIYVISPSALDSIPCNMFFSMPELINKLVEQKRIVETYPIECEWHDIGTMEDYKKINGNLEEIK